jgi:serine-type D-Ala-D-Ala carboxypeptidase
LDDKFIKINASIANILNEGIAENAFSHAAVGFGNLARKTRHVCLASNDGRSVFDLASMTKALSTGFILNELVNEYGLSYNLTINEICSKLGITHELSPKVGQQVLGELLGHRSMFPAWGCLWINRLELVDNLWDKREYIISSHLNRILDERSTSEPCYSDLGYILCGFLIELITGKSQDVVFRERVADHGQHLLGYAPQLDLTSDQIVPAGLCRIRKKDLIGDVHDENCASLGGVSGHAGLFGDVEGVIDSLEFMHGQGLYFLRNIELLGSIRPNDGLIGMRQNKQESIKPFAQGKAMGHLGFTGTSFYINPVTWDYVVFLTNRVFYGRKNPKIGRYRSLVHNALENFYLLSGS